MKISFLYLLGTIFLGAALPALGQGPLKPVVRGLNIASKVTSAAAVAETQAAFAVRAERFVLPGFDLRNAANLVTTLADSPHKQLLSSHTSYTQDNAQISRVLVDIYSRRTPLAPQVISQVHSLVKDSYLKKVINKQLSDNDYVGLLWDLSGFYSLPPNNHISFSTASGFSPTGNINLSKDVFIGTTLSFLNHHPHKVPLRLREMLKAPQIGAKYKGIVNTLLREPTPFSQQTTQGFSSVLSEIYTEYSQLLRQAYQSEEVQTTVSFYNKALNELENFAAAHERAPRWDGPMEERLLYNQLMIITRNNPFNQFTEALQPLQEIKDILAKYPVSTLSWEETLAQVELFIQRNGFFPRSYEATGGNTTEEELRLLDQIKYYTFRHPQLRKGLGELKVKYNLPLD